MSDQTLKLAVAFEAIDKLSGTLKQLSAGSKGLGREFKALRDATRNLEKTQEQIGRASGLQKSIAENHKSIDMMRRKMRDLNAEMEQAGKPTKEMRKQLRELQKEDRRLSSTVQSQNRELGQYREKLKAAGVNVDRLADEEKRLAGEISASTAKLQQKEKQLKRVAEIQSRAKQVRDVGGKISGAGVTTSFAAGAPILAVGQAAFRAASDVTELESAFDVTFGKASAATRKWAIETGNQLQRSTQEMEGMVMSYQDILKKQMDPAKAVEMSKRLTVLTQDLASFKNLSNQDAKDKIFSGLIGESEPLRAVGVLLSDNAVKAKALSMGFKAVKGQFSEGDKVQARAALIMEQLKDAQGDILRTQGSTENRLKAAATAWDELKVTLGQRLLPVLTPVIDKVAQLLNAFGNLPPGIQQFIIWAGLLAVVLGPALIAIGGMVTAFGALAGIAANAEIALLPLLGTIALIVAALVVAAIVIYRNWDRIKAWFEKNVVPLFERIGKRLEPLKAKFSELFGKAQEMGRQFMAMLEELWNGPLGQKVRVVINLLSDLARIIMAALGDQIMIAINTLIGVAGGLFDMLANGFKAVSALLRGDFAGAWEAVKGMFSGGAAAILAIFDGLKATLKNVGGALIDGLVAGIRAGFDWVKTTVGELATLIPGWMRRPLGINSPSRVFMKIGGGLTSGLAMGVDRTSAHPMQAVRRMAAGVAAAGAISVASASPSMAAAASKRTPGAAVSPPIEIHVHATPGQNADEIAEAVMRKLDRARGMQARRSFEGDR